MFCPKCGYQQVSEDMRFCSRCGFQLAGVAELLAGDGSLLAPESGKPPRRVSRLGAKLIFFSVLLVPVFFAIAIAVDHPIPLFVPLAVFISGLAQVAYKRIFGENLLPEAADRKTTLLSSAEQYFPPGEHLPSVNFNPETADLTAPRSVTDSTTKLLRNKR